MPILQQKLVIKSIEALHDEALSLVPDNTDNRGTTIPPAVLRTATPPQEPPIDAQSDAPSDQDIMGRIDHLLKKLDEDDDITIAPPTDNGPQSNTRNMMGDAGDNATASVTEVDDPANPDSLVLSNTVDHVDKNAIRDVSVDGIPKDLADKTFTTTDDNASDEIFTNDQPGQTIPPDQAQALADIASAIYQARQQAVDTAVADASQDNATPFDMGVLSATIADEVRRTVSEVMITELPQMVRDAVGEAIRALPADPRSLSSPTTGNSSQTKSVGARKTNTIKKSVAKKARIKKTAAKKAASVKASAKKTAPSK